MKRRSNVILAPSRRKDMQKYLLLLVKRKHFSFVSVTILRVCDYSLFCAEKVLRYRGKIRTLCFNFFEG